MTRPKFAKSFVIAGAALIAITAIALPLANMLVDPFRAFGGPEIPGLTAVKPETTNRGRLSKAFSVCRVRPDMIFMGSSRNEFLFNPEQALVKKTAAHPYNLALAGTNIYEISLMLRHATLASGRLKSAVIGIDFLMFNADREAESVRREIVDFSLDRLILTDRDSCFSAYMREIGTLLFSAAALKSSYDTLAQQEFSEIYLADGHRHPYYNMLASALRKPKVSQEGGLVGTASAYAKLVWLPPPTGRYCFRNETGSISTLDAFREMVAFARARGVKLTFAMNPEHFALAGMLKEIGLQAKYEDWKRHIVAIIDADARKHGDGGFPVFDFTGMNEITAERPPEAGSPIRMTYWYESSHATQVVGEMMLDRMLGAPPSEAPENFGVTLKPEMLESHLAKAREQLARYYTERADLVKGIQAAARSLPSLTDKLKCPDFPVGSKQWNIESPLPMSFFATGRTR